MEDKEEDFPYCGSGYPAQQTPTSVHLERGRTTWNIIMDMQNSESMSAGQADQALWSMDFFSPVTLIYVQISWRGGNEGNRYIT